jgi:hypothetical protein
MHGRVKNWECPHLPQNEGKLLPKESSDFKGKLGWQWKARNSSRGVDHVLGPLFPTTGPAMTMLTLISIVQANISVSPEEDRCCRSEDWAFIVFYISILSV